jgi:hypothetical protein
MSAESREKAEENGQKSGKGSELVSKVVESELTNISRSPLSNCWLATSE